MMLLLGRDLRIIEDNLDILEHLHHISSSIGPEFGIIWKYWARSGVVIFDDVVAVAPKMGSRGENIVSMSAVAFISARAVLPRPSGWRPRPGTPPPLGPPLALVVAVGAAFRGWRCVIGWLFSAVGCCFWCCSSVVLACFGCSFDCF